MSQPEDRRLSDEEIKALVERYRQAGSIDDQISALLDDVVRGKVSLENSKAIIGELHPNPDILETALRNRMHSYMENIFETFAGFDEPMEEDIPDEDLDAFIPIVTHRLSWDEVGFNKTLLTIDGETLTLDHQQIDFVVEDGQQKMVIHSDNGEETVHSFELDAATLRPLEVTLPLTSGGEARIVPAHIIDEQAMAEKIASEEAIIREAIKHNRMMRSVDDIMEETDPDLPVFSFLDRLHDLMDDIAPITIRQGNLIETLEAPYDIRFHDDSIQLGRIIISLDGDALETEYAEDGEIICWSEGDQTIWLNGPADEMDNAEEFLSAIHEVIQCEVDGGGDAIKVTLNGKAKLVHLDEILSSFEHINDDLDESDVMKFGSVIELPLHLVGRAPITKDAHRIRIMLIDGRLVEFCHADD